jgi:hypothetical protein
MKKPTNEELTKLADAAFEQAAQKVIERAEESGTPLIVCVDEEVKAVEPGELLNGSRRTGHGGRNGRRGD